MKLLRRFGSAVFVAAVLFGLIACPSHTHTFSDEWKSDETHHWHEATCEHTEETDGKAEHEFATKTENGTETTYCKICNYVKETHTHTFSTEWKSDATHHWHAATCEHTEEIEGKAEHTWDSGTMDDDKTKYTCTVCSATKVENGRNWLKVDSLKEAYVASGIFDHIGFATSMPEITSAEVREGVKRHANSFTMGNAMKPQWFLWHYVGVPSHNTDFTASNGKTIKVPDSLPTTDDSEHGFGGMDVCLQHAKDMGIQIRGHVLTWHSQTFDWFFCTDYDVSKGLLPSTDEGKAEMSARHEWYIKTVLDHVADWEKKNGYAGHENGNHVIYTWDVLNEAVADDASEDNYYRGTTPVTKNIATVGNGCNSNGDSRWWQIYQSNEFIINAFRFANKYAPSDVTLCYNDYNEYLEYGDVKKRSGIVKLLNAVKNDPGITYANGNTLKARIDVMGMQSHIESFVSVGSIKTTIETFLETGLDIHVTELDYKWNKSFQDGKGGNFDRPLADIYTDYFKLYQKYAKSKRKEDGKTNGITGVTVWGVEDANTWLNPSDKSATYYPVLFERDSGDNLVAKDTFYAVLNAAGKTAD